MERARFIMHKDRQLYLMYCNNETVEEMNQVIEAYDRDVCSQPENSVLTLIIAGVSSFSSKTVNRLKELARVNTQYVKA